VCRDCDEGLETACSAVFVICAYSSRQISVYSKIEELSVPEKEKTY
jgi:hypothetical protein